VRRILLIGAGHAHLAVLRKLARDPLHGARLMLVSPSAKQLYSGMLPGLLAGHYRRHEAQIDVETLAERAYAEFVKGAAAKLDPERRLVVLEDGSELNYDVLSLNVGSRVADSIPGAAHALAAKPFERFLLGLEKARPARIAVAGGGAAGAELAMALRYRGAAVTLYSDQPLSPPPLAARTAAALRRLGVDFRPGMAVDAIEAGPVIVSGSSRQAFDTAILATGAAPLAWLRGCGLACDERGYLAVQNTLQSVSHPEVFASGDCATVRGASLPKSGVYSVRQGEALAASFANLVKGQAPARYRPQRRALVLLSCGERYAIAYWGAQSHGYSAEGAWAWRWKDWIDRGWVRGLAG
jgi:pyridine nucleotide-disulfide oxidoreductase family protein